MRADIRQQLRTCKTLPSLPAVAVQLIDLSQDPNARLDQFAQVISCDPALVSKLLRMVNSAWFRGRQKIDDVNAAVVRLGMDTCVTLALSFSLTIGLRSATETAIDLQGYWRRSLIAATACRTLAQHLHRRRTERYFLAGLLQDVGVLALAAVAPNTYPQLLASTPRHLDLPQRERAALGTDHPEVGGWLVEEWHLPDYLQQSVLASHRAPVSDTGDPDLGPLISCVAVSDRLAELYVSTTDRDAELETCIATARYLLGMGEEDFNAVLITLSEALSEVSDLFEMQLSDEACAQDLMARAETLQAARAHRAKDQA